MSWRRRLLLSIVLAYPLSGVARALLSVIGNPALLIHDPSITLLTFVVGSAWFGILTPLYLGFPISDEGGVNHANMYPYIIPTAIVLFFLFSKGWRWFKRSKP